VYIATTGIPLRAGIFNGGLVTIPNIAPGANAEYFMIGWTGSYATFDAAVAARFSGDPRTFLGESAIATTATGNPTTTPPEAPIPLRYTFAGMILPTVPEPSSFALAGLGALMLMLFRRRR
jgi:hypothetical protein